MTELRTQSRKASLVESFANIVVGLIIQCTAQWCLFAALNIQVGLADFTIFTLVMTVLSVARSYCLRRMWNAEWWKRFKRRHPDKPTYQPAPQPHKYVGPLPPFKQGCRCVLNLRTQRIDSYGCDCDHS